MGALNNIITMIRGDSLTLEIALNDGKTAYELADSDIVYFGLMDPGQLFEDALVKKKGYLTDINDNGKLVFELSPDDTLDLLPGKYYYSIKLHINHGNEDKVITLVNKTKFIICD